MAKTKFICVKSGLPCVFRTPKIIALSQYPSEWFIDNDNKKPIATFNIGGVESNNLYKVVRYGTHHNYLNVNIVRYFIYHYF